MTDEQIAAQVLVDFNGGLIRVEDISNPRGYVSYYRPLEAMTAAIAAVRTILEGSTK